MIVAQVGCKSNDSLAEKAVAFPFWVCYTKKKKKPNGREFPMTFEKIAYFNGSALVYGDVTVENGVITAATAHGSSPRSASTFHPAASTAVKPASSG